MTLSWLGDLALYSGYETLGGRGIILAKAILFSALALTLLRLGGNSPRRSALGALLSLVGLGPWMQLNSNCFSILFLALTLLWLDRHDVSDLRRRSMWPLIALFVVWANVDGWFFLGPLAVLIHAFGGSLRRRRVRDGVASGQTAWLVFALGAAACLVGPLAFRLRDFAAHLIPALSGTLPGDPAATLGISVLDANFWSGAWHEKVPTVAYLFLATAGLLSFARTWSAQTPARLLTFITLLGYSFLDGRVIPFFCLAAGPTLARNLAEQAESLAGGARREPIGGRWARAVRFGLVAFAGVPLLGTVWAGWLQPPPYDRREWRVEADPSVARSAAQIAAWHQEGIIPPEKGGFFFTRSASDAAAWYAPEAAGFPVPGPRPLRPDEAADFERVRAVFTGEGGPEKLEIVRDVFRRRGLFYLVLFDPRPEHFAVAFRRLLSVPSEWPLVYLRGRVAVFAWVDPAGASIGALGRRPLDLGERAFRPGPEDTAPPNAAPQVADPPAWTDPLLRTRPRRSLDRDEAAVYLLHHESTAPMWLLWAGQDAITAAAGSLVLSPALAGPWAIAGDRRTSLMALSAYGAGERPDLLAADLAQAALARFPDAAPGDPLLAIRAARRALAVDRNNASAYLVLGRAYLRLRQSSRERAWTARLPRLGRLRRVQAACALRQAITLEPRLAAGHLALAGLYRESGYIDLALTHFERYARLAPEGGHDGDDVRRTVTGLTRAVDEARKAVEGSQTNLRVIERAQQAGARGLAGQALETLLASDVAAFGTSGLFMELDLLISTGRLREVREWMAPQHSERLGEGNYLWLLAQAEAASGQYAQADLTLAELASGPVAAGADGGSIDPRAEIATAVGQMVIDAAFPARTPDRLVLRESARADKHSIIVRAAATLREQADALVLRGLLALEAGDVARAEALFADALSLWHGPTDADTTAGMDFAGRPVAQECLALLRRSGGAGRGGRP